MEGDYKFTESVRKWSIASFDRGEEPGRPELARKDSGLVHVSTLPSFRNPLKPTDTSQLFDKFSHDFVHELEKQHERALANAYFKLSAQEENHSKIVEALKTQVTSLRQQLEVNKQLHDQDDMRKRKDFDEALRSALGDKEKLLFDLQHRSEDLRKAIESQEKHNLELREELAASKAIHEEAMSQAKAHIEDLQQEIQALRTHSLLPAEQEIEKLKADKKAIREDFERIIQALKKDHQEAFSDLGKKLESKNSLISHLETEVNEVRRQMAIRSQETERDTAQLQDAIRALKNACAQRDEEVKRLRKSREESSKEARLLEKETSLLEHELARMRKDNDDLRGHGVRMERLVYGKGRRN